MKGSEKTLDALLSDLCEGLRQSGFDCLGAIPVTPGRLLLQFADTGQVWRAFISTWPLRGQVRKVGDLYLSIPSNGDEKASLVRNSRTAREISRLATCIEALRAGGQAPWLDLHNREVREVEGISGLLRLLAWIVEPSRRFFGSWSLLDGGFIGPHKEGVRFVLKDLEGGSIRNLVLTPELKKPPQGRVIAVTSLGVLYQEGEQEDTSNLAGSPEAAFGLIFALSVPPTAIWSKRPLAPTPKPAEPSKPQPLRQDDSLLIHCYRTDHEWHLPRSRFFNTWGDKDFFILLGVISEPIQLVFHGNRECQQVRQCLSDGFAHGATPFVPSRQIWDWMVRKIHFTDTDDHAAVFGGEPRLEALLSQLYLDDPDHEVRVFFGCDAEMIGDDVPRVCSKARSCGQAVECFNPPISRFTDAFDRNWWKIFVHRAAAKRSPRPNSIALAGFQWPGHQALEEIEALAREAGVEVVLRMLPGQSPDIASALGLAKLTVASPWYPVQDALVEALKSEGFEVCSPPLPFGVRGTRRWLDHVCEALSLPSLPEAQWKKMVAHHAPSIEALREKASRFTVALAADWGSVPEMVSPAFFFGFDPVDFFLDLGFRVALVGRQAREVKARYEEFSERVIAVEADPFETSLVPLIRDIGARLVYCDRHDVSAAIEAGALPFGISELEFGLAGAQRTLRRLLARANLKVFERLAGPRWVL